MFPALLWPPQTPENNINFEFCSCFLCLDLQAEESRWGQAAFFSGGNWHRETHPQAPALEPTLTAGKCQEFLIRSTALTPHFWNWRLGEQNRELWRASCAPSSEFKRPSRSLSLHVELYISTLDFCSILNGNFSNLFAFRIYFIISHIIINLKTHCNVFCNALVEKKGKGPSFVVNQ